MEAKTLSTLYNELAAYVDKTGNIVIKDIDRATYDRQLKLLKLDLNSKKDSHKNAALQVLHILADNNIHSIQTDALDLLDIDSLEPKQKLKVIISLGSYHMKACLRDKNIEDLALLNTEWAEAQFTTTLKHIIGDVEYKQYSKDILFNILMPFIMDPNNTENESMQDRINLAIEFASIIPFAVLTEKESEEFFLGIHKYIDYISDLRDKNSNNWHKLWIVLVTLLGEKLHESLYVINKLLRVVEGAFRSSSNEQRLQGYDCWKELINNASLSMNHLSSSRQLKLILTPLKAKFSKREPLVTKRFELFVYLLEKLQDKAVLVLKEFLEFCFGEVGENADPKKSGFVKRSPELWLRCTQVVLMIIGHSHQSNEECLSTDTDIHLMSPIVNSNNIENIYWHIIMATSECCKFLKDIQLDVDRVAVSKCFWRSLLNIILVDNVTQTEKVLPAVGSVLNNLLKDRDPYCQSIAAVIFEETIAIGKSKALPLVLNQSDNFLNIIFSVPLSKGRCTTVTKFLAMLDTMEGTDLAKIRTDLFNSFIHFKTVQDNADCVREVWIYVVNEFEDYARGDSLDFLLWPVLHLHQFGQLDTESLAYEHCKHKLVPFIQKSDELMLAFFKQLEKIMKNNPLLLMNVLTMVGMFQLKTNHKEIANTVFNMLAGILSVPMTGGNKDQLVVEVEDIVKRLLAADLSNICDTGTIQKVCTCIEEFLKQKHYLVLPCIENILKEVPESTKLLYMKFLSVDFLMDVYSKEADVKATEAIPRIVKLLEPMKSSEVKQDVAAVLPLKGRSAKIAKLVKEMPKSPTKSLPSQVLKYFGKNVEAHTPLKIIGSQLNKTPVKVPKSPKTPTSHKKKKQTCIDDESNSRFVLIETEVKVDKNKLTDHQKEALKKRREDIPALYQDLSQSVSQSFDAPSVESVVEPDCFKKPTEINGDNADVTNIELKGNGKPAKSTEKKIVTDHNISKKDIEINDDKIPDSNTEHEKAASFTQTDISKETIEVKNVETDKVANIQKENGTTPAKKVRKKVATESEVAEKPTEIDMGAEAAGVSNIEQDNETPAEKVKVTEPNDSKKCMEITDGKSDEVADVEQDYRTPVKKVANLDHTQPEVFQKSAEIHKDKTDVATEIEHVNGTPGKNSAKKVDSELRKLSMNIVGADDFFSVGSKRKRRAKNMNEKVMQKFGNTIEHITADSSHIASKKHHRDHKGVPNKQMKKAKTAGLSKRRAVPEGLTAQKNSSSSLSSPGLEYSQNDDLSKKHDRHHKNLSNKQMKKAETPGLSKSPAVPERLTAQKNSSSSLSSPGSEYSQHDDLSKKHGRYHKNISNKRMKKAETPGLLESPTVPEGLTAQKKSSSSLSSLGSEYSQNDLSEVTRPDFISVANADQSLTKLEENKGSEMSSKTCDEADKKIRKSGRKSTPSKKFADFKTEDDMSFLESLGNGENESRLNNEDIEMSATNMENTISDATEVTKEVNDAKSTEICNGETKNEKVNDELERTDLLKESGRVSASMNRKRKRISDSDCDEDIIESSQEPSMIKETRVLTNRRSSHLEKPKPSGDGEASTDHQTLKPRPSPKTERLTTVDAVIEVVIKDSASYSQSKSFGAAKKGKKTAVESKGLNLPSAIKSPKTSGNDEIYVEKDTKKRQNSIGSNNSISDSSHDDEDRKVSLVNPEIDENRSDENVQKHEESDRRRSRKSEKTNLRKSPRKQDVSLNKSILNSPAKKKIAFLQVKLVAEDTIKDVQSQDTQTQDSETVITSESESNIRLDLPQKSMMTESEQAIAEMETASMSLTDTSTCVMNNDLKLYINDALVEDETIVDDESNLETVIENNDRSRSERLIEEKHMVGGNADSSANDGGNEDGNGKIIPNTEVDKSMKVEKSLLSSGPLESSLPTSPVTAETPNRTTEFFSNTFNISPIGSDAELDSDCEGLDKPKLVPVALKFDSEDDQQISHQQKSPEKGDDAPLKANDTSTENAGKVVDIDPDPRDVQNSPSVKRIKKFNWIKQASPTTQKLTGRKKGSYGMSPSVSRIKKLMAKVNPQSQNEDTDETNPDDILTFSREVPSPLATPKTGILKRKHPDTMDDDLTPCPKRKRVNFSDPCTTSKKVFIKDDGGPLQCLFSDDDLDKQFLEVLASNMNPNPQSVSDNIEIESCSGETQCSLEATSSSLLRTDQPIYPDLVNCEESIGIISRKLTAPMFVNTLLTKLNNKNLKTIGDLARLSEASIVELPFKVPMVYTLFKALDCYYHKNFKSKVTLEAAVDPAAAVSVDKESPPKSQSLPESGSGELDVQEELSKIVGKAISANVPSTTICSVVLESLDQKQVLTWFKEHSNFDVRDLVQENQFSSLVAHISKTVGLPKVIEMLSESHQQICRDSDESVAKLSLAAIIEKNSLDEVQAALWENVDQKVYDRNDFLETCFLSKINLIDLSSFFNKLTAVEVGDIVVNRLATEDHALFFNRILNELGANPEVKLNILNNFDITDLTSNIVRRGTSQQIISSFTYMFLSADKNMEDLVQIFRLVSDHLVEQLPPSQLMELVIDCLRKIPIGK